MGIIDSIKNMFGPVNYQKPVSPEVSKPPQYYLKDRNTNLNDSDFESIKPILYGEISNRAPNKQQLESSVIMNTALNRMKAYRDRGTPKTLAEVLSMPNQYQAYKGPQYNNYFNPPDAPSLNKKKQVDMMVASIKDQMKGGQFSDNTEGAYYYTHNKDKTIQYDNLKKLFAS
jgi:hypothetical protein